MYIYIYVEIWHLFELVQFPKVFICTPPLAFVPEPKNIVVISSVLLSLFLAFSCIFLLHFLHIHQLTNIGPVQLDACKPVLNPDTRKHILYVQVILAGLTS